MTSNRIVKFDPWLLGSIQKAMGKLPAIPGDLAKLKSLTSSDGGYLLGEEGLLLNGWIELASGEFSAIGKMPNLHTLLFKNHRTLKIGNFDFLCQCRKLKKLDLSGTDFSDCALLAELPNLQYVMLPDRRQLIHTQVLEHIQAQAETEPEMNARSRANCCIDTAKRRTVENHTGIYTADSNLIYWIAVSLGKIPRMTEDLETIRLLDSRKRFPSLEHAMKDHLSENLPAWLTIKKGDFSLIGKLPNLQALLLWGIELDDFSFLPECRELVYINLWDTNFRDCSLLAELPYLREIDLPEKRQLENFSLLEKCRDDYLQNEHQKLEDYLYHTESDEIKHFLATLPAFYLECERDSEQEMVCVKCSDRLVMTKIPKSVRSNEVTEIVDEEEDCDALMIIRGEDVVLSYEGESRVRHVEADFCMDQMPVLWKIFSRVSDEEDNWAKLSPQKARQLTDVLVDAIIKENVATLTFLWNHGGKDTTLFWNLWTGGWILLIWMTIHQFIIIITILPMPIPQSYC